MADEELTPAALSKRFEAVEALAAAWKNTGLAVFQKGAAESDALRIAANAELVSAGRREVSGKTREFAKLEPEQKLAELGSLVKSYQAYVDEITRALRHAESAHRNTHQFLKQLQDPYPTLEKFLRCKSSIVSLANAATSTSSLRAQLREREAELGELRNQEVTIRQLREEIAQLELSAATNDRQAASDASAETQQLLQQWQERENAVQMELAQLSQECRKHQLLAADLKQELSTAQDDLRSVRAQVDREADEHQTELTELRIQLGVAEHDRAKLNEHIAGLEQQLQAGRTPASAVRQRPPRSPARQDNGDDTTPQGQVMARPRADDEGDQQQQPKRPAEAPPEELLAVTKARDEAMVKLAQAEAQIADLRQAAEAAEKRRVQSAEEHQRATAALEGTVAGLRSELAAGKSQLAEAADRERSLRATVVDLQADLSTAERKLTAAASSSSSAGQTGTAASPPSVATAGSAATFDLQAIVQQSTASNPVSANGRGTPVGGASSDAEVIATLKQQREGLRRRIRALEEVGLAEVKSMRAEIDTLRRENADLLGQLNGSTRDPLAEDAEPAPRHPPSLFGLARQSAVDRAAHVVSHLVLSSRQSRRAFAAYQLVLHVVLVLFAAYYIL
mmetsp:Transcript_7593/g.23684  ORF Transcript_7593/g.23684 Transcript_7593/m.23684 type:complete len:624 (-) Transcript_7593:71-1942(-)